MQKKKEQFYDKHARATFSRNNRIPVLINYSVGSNRFEKVPDAKDLSLVRRIEEHPIKDFFPTFELPYAGIMTHERVKIADYGVHRFNHFFMPRQLIALSTVWRLAYECDDARIRRFMLYMVEQCVWGMSIMARYAQPIFPKSTNT